MLMASLALRTAAFKPLICAVMFSRTDKPAASSDALLMRLPVDKLCIVFCMARSLDAIALAEAKARILVLITDMFTLLEVGILGDEWKSLADQPTLLVASTITESHLFLPVPKNRRFQDLLEG
jgi:hypothetical protein